MKQNCESLLKVGRGIETCFSFLRDDLRVLGVGRCRTNFLSVSVRPAQTSNFEVSNSAERIKDCQWLLGRRRDTVR